MKFNKEKFQAVYPVFIVGFAVLVSHIVDYLDHGTWTATLGLSGLAVGGIIGWWITRDYYRCLNGETTMIFKLKKECA